jgi:predicted nucleic acid-binding protein
LARSALLDANVLHPQILCDLLLRLAEHDAFRPLWSARILDETIESILRRRPDLDRTRLQRRMDAMREAFPDACVTGYERLMPTMPEMGEDAHVLAAALNADADVIVTDNVKDFPPHVAPRFDIAVRTADDFLIEIWRRDPRLVAGVVVEQSQSTHRPHFEPRQLLQALGKVVPEFARLVAASAALQDELDAD